ERLRPLLPADCRIVLLGEAATGFPVIARYDELVAAEGADFEWPVFDEWTASALCYTSGTTGKPKGALYSHRATVLHAWALAGPGHDRDEPARHRRGAKGETSRRRPRGADGDQNQGRAARVRRRDEDCRRPGPGTAA